MFIFLLNQIHHKTCHGKFKWDSNTKTVFSGAMGALYKQEIGNVVTVTVTTTTDAGCICKTRDGLKGFATFEHTAGKRDRLRYRVLLDVDNRLSSPSKNIFTTLPSKKFHYLEQ